MDAETWRLIVAESEAVEAAEVDQIDSPLPDHVKVSRPNRADSRAVQVWLRNSEADALEAIAAQRDLPVSTVARAHLLGLIGEYNSQ